MDNQQSFRCFIVDDEPLAGRLLEDYIDRTPGLELVFKTGHPLEALERINKGEADVVFLDVQMPELNGVELMRMIRHPSCQVILTTAYTQYAFEGFEHDVVDYLLKPITYERFGASVVKLQERNSRRLAAGTAAPLFIKTGHRIQKIDLASVCYIEGLRDYIAFHMTTGKYLTLENLKEMETLLPSGQFIRIHRSYIVNKHRIDYVEKGRVVIGTEFLPIGETYREEVMTKLGFG